MRAARRVWQIWWDCLQILRGLLRAIGWAIVPSQPAADLAVLEGEPIARAGERALYRVRVHNPTTFEHSLRVLITGRREGTAEPEFQLRWNVTLAPGESAERWVRSTWCGDTILLDGPSPDIVPVWKVTEPAGGWTVEAKILEAGNADLGGLRIAGTLIR
jgi:hypothetical protein